jgi:hypothetical protein
MHETRFPKVFKNFVAISLFRKWSRGVFCGSQVLRATTLLHRVTRNLRVLLFYQKIVLNLQSICLLPKFDLVASFICYDNIFKASILVCIYM